MNVDLICTRLEANGAVFQNLFEGITPEQACWRPAADKWSAVEIINHLADEEVEDFRTRLMLTLSSPEEPWPPIDPEGWVSARDYASRPLAECVARFLNERKGSVAWLRTLAGANWNASHLEPNEAPTTAGDLLTSWLEHDFLHIRQLLRLYRQYYHEQAPGTRVHYAGEW